MIRAAIINVTGYVGAELARLLAGHPQVEIACLTGRSQAGKRLPEVFPHLWSVDLPILDNVEGECGCRDLGAAARGGGGDTGAVRADGHGGD